MSISEHLVAGLPKIARINCMEKRVFGVLESRQQWPQKSLGIWSLQKWSALPKIFFVCLFVWLSSSSLPKCVHRTVQSSGEQRLFRRLVTDVSSVCVIYVRQILLHDMLSQRLMMDKFQKVWNLQIIDLEELPQQWSIFGSYQNSLFPVDLYQQPQKTETAKGAPSPLPEQKGYKFVKHIKKRKTLPSLHGEKLL